MLACTVISKTGVILLQLYLHRVSMTAMPADLLAICFQLNCQPWVWPIFPFIPSSENIYMCTKHPHADYSEKTLSPHVE